MWRALTELGALEISLACLMVISAGISSFDQSLDLGTPGALICIKRAGSEIAN
jgi:hypothetical protein